MIYAFEDYELNLQRYELRYAGKIVKLEPQVFNVLVYLIQRRDRVVTKDELIAHVWAGRIVSEATLTSRLMAARKAVGDRGREQRLIQTLHGRGYRFIGAVEERDDQPFADQRQAAPLSPPLPCGRTPIPSDQEAEALSVDALSHPLVTPPASRMVGGGRDRQLVGRQAELTCLRHRLQRARDGVRQVVFVTGEAGLGKTTVVDAFIEAARAQGVRRIGRGQCIEHYGAGEAYMPVLEALGHLCRGPEAAIFVEVLARQAPTWLMQLPWLSDTADEAWQQRAQRATPARMLREMAEAIEALTAQDPLILILDDLHWSDYATLDLIALLAQRREPAHFLLVGAYRPEAVRARERPLQGLVQMLQLRRHCHELALSALEASEVEAYVAARFMNGALAAALGPILYRRTEGNPLFMVNLLEHWVARGWLYRLRGQWTLRTDWEAITREIPTTLRELVTQRQAQLSATEQRLLEVASVAGLECSAASIAAGLGAEVVETETWCEELAQHGQFLQTCGVETWPDGTVSARYRFQHALYQDVVYERIPGARQAMIHRRIGGREEVGYGERCGEIAARLAMHFERGHDIPRAIAYHHRAAEQAMQRSGYQEAIWHLRRGLELLQQSPESRERTQQELPMQLVLGSALRATKAFGAPDVEQTYLRAYELCRRLGEPPQLFPVLYSLYELYEYLGAFERSGELGQQLLHYAGRRQDATLLLGAYDARACTAFHLGAFADVLHDTGKGLALYEPQQHSVQASLYGKDLGVSCRYWSAMARWFLGYTDEALRWMDEALAMAQELAHAYTVSVVHTRAAFLAQFRRQTQAVYRWAEATLAVAAEHGFQRHAALGEIFRGWALAMPGRGQEGVAHIQRGMAAYQRLGMAMETPYFLALLAEAQASCGLIEEGLATVAEALSVLSDGRDFFYKAELYRLEGVLLLRRSAPDVQRAEACFRQGLDLAYRQRAKSLELRAALSLSRLWQWQGRRTEARELLAPVYAWFTEGFDTPDLQEAAVLLQELA